MNDYMFYRNKELGVQHPNLLNLEYKQWRHPPVYLPSHFMYVYILPTILCSPFKLVINEV